MDAPSTPFSPLPDLGRDLAPLLGGPAPVPIDGPRRWWAGPLDVEGLAIGSAAAVAGALQHGSTNHRFSLDTGAIAASFASFTHLRVDGVACSGFAPLSGFHRTADGWIRLHANYPHHERALLAALEVSEPEDAARAITSATSDALERRVGEHGGLAAAVRTPVAWLGDEGTRALGERPWIRLEIRDVPADRPGRAGQDGRPLAGIRVLDLTRVIAGPSASRLLGALGADVLRVDPPTIPELWDHHADTGFDKRSAVVDLADPDGLRRLHGLAAHADAVMLGYRLDALERRGFGPRTLLERHPHLAVVSLDAWDVADPGRRGFDSIVQAATGIAHLYGTGIGDDWRPGALPVQALDHATGLGMAAALVALVSARSEGLGGRAHLSLARTALELLATPVPDDPPQPLTAPVLRRTTSPYGTLNHVAPPLAIDGRPLEFTRAPQAYGEAEPVWR